MTRGQWSENAAAGQTVRITKRADAVGVYVHVPFCRRKCRYCDFYSREAKEGEQDRFVAAVIREIEVRCPKGGRAETVYFGGGTPSILGAERLAKILEAIRDRFEAPPDAEVTVEANPLDVTREWAAGCLSAGFNRISVGVQSADEPELRLLGRLHGAIDGPRAARIARDAGFREIGIDLIYGLPGQTPETVRDRLRAAVAACGMPEHVSCYQLTYAEGTPLGQDAEAGRVRRLSEEEERAAFLCVHRTMAELGYDGYEVSNFARKDGGPHRSRHNSRYWRHEPYLGLGPSAHSFEPPVRSWNVRSVEGYLGATESGRSAAAGSERLTEHQLAAEMVMLALRTADGLDLGEYRRRFGRDFAAESGRTLDEAVRAGLLIVSDGRARPTLEGLAVADGLAAELAPAG